MSFLLPTQEPYQNCPNFHLPPEPTSERPPESTSQCPPESARKRKTRGPTTCKKLKKKKKDGSITVVFDDLNRPIGEHAKDFKSYLSTLVRSRIDINIDHWHHVSPGLKDTIWNDMKKTFNLLDDQQKQVTLQKCGQRWRDFKAYLVREFIHKKHKKYESPTECYDFLENEQWKKFKIDHTTKEFMEISQKQREKQKHNLYPHRLGQAGYAGKKPYWLISDPLSSQSACASISSAIGSNDRCLDWSRARTKKCGGKYTCPEEIIKVLQKFSEKSEEINQGSFQPDRQHDVLAAVLDTKKGDCGGFVRGVGTNVNVRDVFGKPKQPRERNLTEKIKKEVYSDIEKVLFSKFKDEIYKGLKDLSKDNNEFCPARTPQSVDMPSEQPRYGRSSVQSVDPYPFAQIQDDLTIKEKSNEHSNEEDDHSAETDDQALKWLDRAGKKLYKFVKSYEDDYLKLKQSSDIFHIENRTISVMMESIEDFLRMKWLAGSIIQVFIVYLHQLCNGSVGFVCPTQLAGNPDAIEKYINGVLKKLGEKNWILAPYNEMNHWLLLVLCVNSRKVYVLNSMMDYKLLMRAKRGINKGYRMAVNKRGSKATCVEWIDIKCPQQRGTTECGYYVMKYMYEICTKYSEFTSFDKAFGDTQDYPMEELNPIRQLWIEYFLNNRVVRSLIKQ